MALASPDPLTRLTRRSSFLMALGFAATACAADRQQLSLLLLEVAPDNHSPTGPEHAAPLPVQTVSKVIRLGRDAGRNCRLSRVRDVRHHDEKGWSRRSTRRGEVAADGAGTSPRETSGPYQHRRRVNSNSGALVALGPFDPGGLASVGARRAGRSGLNFCSYDLRRLHFASWPWV
jgi:hypothetical protein